MMSSPGAQERRGRRRRRRKGTVISGVNSESAACQVSSTALLHPPACQSSLGVASVAKLCHVYAKKKKEPMSEPREERRTGGEIPLVLCFLIPVTDKTGGFKSPPSVRSCPGWTDRQSSPPNTSATQPQRFLFGLLTSGRVALALMMLLCARGDSLNWAPPPCSVKLAAGLCLDHGAADLTEGQRQTNRRMKEGLGGGGVTR